VVVVVGDWSAEWGGWDPNENKTKKKNKEKGQKKKLSLSSCLFSLLFSLFFTAAAPRRFPACSGASTRPCRILLLRGFNSKERAREKEEVEFRFFGDF
jgi:hypothetical protein